MVVILYTCFSGWQAMISNGQLKALNKANDQTRKNLELNFGTEMTVLSIVYQLESRPDSMVMLQFHTVPVYDTATNKYVDRPINNIVVSTSIDFRDPTSIPPIEMPSDAPVKDLGLTLRLPKACMNLNKEACVYPVYKNLSWEGYQDYAKKKKDLFIWGTVTYSDNTGSRQRNFCQYTSADETGTEVNGAINHNADFSKVSQAAKDAKWQECPGPR
jgi:hypothetical protein